MKEDLPLPFVHYTGSYGVFLGFGETPQAQPKLCSCAEDSVIKYLALREKSKDRYSKPEYKTKLSLKHFPQRMVDISLANEDPLTCIEFQQNICHRCNQKLPTRRFCLELYGGVFRQIYGWYINQAHYRNGVVPLRLSYLPDICPPDLVQMIEEWKLFEKNYLMEKKRLMEIVHGPRRTDIGPHEKTFWSNVRFEEAERFCLLRKEEGQLKQRIDNHLEDIARNEFGIRGVGESWISESVMAQLAAQLFPEYKMFRHYRPEWLEGLELDVFFPDLSLGLEYQGEQHFEPVECWGGVEALLDLQARDLRKVIICQNRGIKLLLYNYFEPLDAETLKSKLNHLGIW